MFEQARQEIAAFIAANADKGEWANAARMLLLAKVYRTAKQDAEAIEVFEAINKDNPEHVEAGIQLAELLTPKKEPDRVIAVLQPLLKLKHTYSLYHLLAEAHY